MTRRSFMRRSRISLTVAPVVETVAPTLLTAFVGQQLTYLNARPASGVLVPTFSLTEVLNASNAVVASSPNATVSYTVQAGDVLRIRQTYSITGVTETKTSSPMAASASPVTGWDMPVPTAVNTATYTRVDVRQPGSRMFFINPQTGEVPTAVNQMDMVYFWNGSAIIDYLGNTAPASGVNAGVAYGNDPYNPSVSVRRWKFWAACGPTRTGMQPGIRTGNEYGGLPCPGPWNFDGGDAPRSNKPDWWGFERGCTFDLAGDLADYKASSAGAAFTSPIQSLSTGSGSGVGNETVMFSFGSLSLPMPKMTSKKGWNYANRIGGDWSHVRYLDLWFDGYERDADAVVTGTSWTNMAGTSTNGRHQGCHFRGTKQTNFLYYGDWEFRRGLIIDEFYLGNGNNSGTDLHESTPHGAALTISESILSRNGYRWYNPKRIASGEQFVIHDPAAAYSIGQLIHNADRSRTFAPVVAVAAGSATSLPGDYGQNTWFRHVGTGTIALGTSFDRNMYMDARTVLRDCIVLPGASGDQFRRGGIVDRCFMMMGSFFIGMDKDGALLPSAVTDNAFQNWVNSAPHSGTCFQFQGAINGCEVTRNIFTKYGNAEQRAGFGVQFAYIRNAESKASARYNFSELMRNCSFHHNILDSGAALPISVVQGWDDTTDIAPTQAERDAWNGVGLVSCSAYSNVMITQSPAPDVTYPDTIFGKSFSGGSASSNLTTSNNLRYTSWAAATAANGYADYTWSLKKWLVSVGVTIDPLDQDDGRTTMTRLVAGEYAATGNRPLQRGNWLTQFVALPLVNSFRSSFGMTALT